MYDPGTQASIAGLNPSAGQPDWVQAKERVEVTERL